MTNEELKELYEKLYFHEVEARDKIHSRLQLPLTLLLAIGGGAVFLFQNFDYQAGAWNAQRVTFAFFFCSAVVILIVGMVCFVMALWNHDYLFLPDSEKTAEYKKLLDKTYESFDGRDKLISDALDQYLTGYYIKYAAFNTQVNDRRSAFIHYCNGAVIGAATLFIAAYLAFYFGDLDKSKIKAANEVVITKPIEVRILEHRK